MEDNELVEKVREILNNVTESYYIGLMTVTKADNKPYTTYTVDMRISTLNHRIIKLDAINDDDFFMKIEAEFKKHDFGFVKHIKIVKTEC